MKSKRARYCSTVCRVKSYRSRKGIPEPFKNFPILNHTEENQEAKSFTCCKNGRFYSPVGLWGKILVCDACGKKWYSTEYYRENHLKSMAFKDKYSNSF